MWNWFVKAAHIVSLTTRNTPLLRFWIFTVKYETTFLYENITDHWTVTCAFCPLQYWICYLLLDSKQLGGRICFVFERVWNIAILRLGASEFSNSSPKVISSWWSAAAPVILYLMCLFGWKIIGINLSSVGLIVVLGPVRHLFFGQRELSYTILWKNCMHFLYVNRKRGVSVRDYFYLHV